ncbi:MAG: 4-hydroxy-3-methylbut-2-enyl diphosphate reductase [Clostridia bacterium]|nr:4-hydroxy-3-methylbut-2-enyl diphosphate reductase [Clostridia bacterium]
MRVIFARNMGFCFGVQRAVDMALSQCENGQVYTYGQIIHNESVVEDLKRKGIVPIERVETLNEGDTLIIRAHGAPPQLFFDCERRGIRMIDATCPFVKRIHSIVRRARDEGIKVYIAGKKAHPEVIGTAGWAGEGCVILESAADAKGVESGERGCLVAQTTLDAELFEAIAAELLERISALDIQRTICDTTVMRQREARELSKICTRMLILGSENSANTRALQKICQKSCPKCKTIENIGKIMLENFETDDIIGIVAGASAPDPMIREVKQVMSELENTTIETNEAEAPAEVVAETTETVVTEEPAAEEVTVAEEPAAEPAARDRSSGRGSQGGGCRRARDRS